MIPQALLSSKQLQTWMGLSEQNDRNANPTAKGRGVSKWLSWDPGMGHEVRHERGPQAPG